MAYSDHDQQQPNFKHFCKICKKGFMCGRALGGHMRAHGVGDEIENLDDDDSTGGGQDHGNEKTYALRTNPNRFSRFCENCGKEFLSWKSFLEHGKCGSENGESSLVWSQETDDDEDGYDGQYGGYGGGVGVGGGWSKRKRSSRVCSSENEEDVALAKCLMALSNTRVDHLMEMKSEDNLYAANKKEEQRRNPIFSPVILSDFTKSSSPLDKAKGVVAATTPKGMFECKACKKVFNSHQALGGHRASHKNVKGCFAARNDQYDDNLADEDFIVQNDYKPNNTYHSDHGPSAGPGPVSLAGRKSKVHKCTICSRVFTSGQALGGHKRCHWLTSNYTSESSINKFNLHEHIEQLHQRALALPKELELNLNLHAWNATNQQNSHLHAKEDHKHQSNNNNGDQNDHISTTSMENVDGESESKVKLAKLSELNNTNGSSSSWLQVGIGSSSTDVAPDP